MNILGISSYYHDSAACLVQDGVITAAVQEERFTRKKHDPCFPINSIKFCLEDAKVEPEQLAYIVFYEKPFMKFDRLLETYLAFAPKGFRSFSQSMPVWIKDKLFQKRLISKELTNIFGKTVNWEERLLFSEHHFSHAASAFYPSPFSEAAILTMDGTGEWTTTSLAAGNDKEITVLKEIHFPHSIGLLYSAFTYHCGFKVNSGEYKLMGLAPYGEPKYTNLIKDNLIDIKEDGSFQLDMSFFNYCTGLTMTNNNFDRLVGSSPRIPEGELTQREMDLAASIQKVTEEVVVKLATSVAKETKSTNLCLAGGVALNCVANGVLIHKGIFDKVWIQPAAGDAGGALGAALGVYHLMLGKKRLSPKNEDNMKGSFLGPQYSNSEIKNKLSSLNAKFKEFTETEVIEKTAEALKDGKIIGWMNGRMEFGPRALGARSIIADARSPNMQKLLNLKIKYRESFRPFAPSVLSEDVKEWFNTNLKSPYMLLVAEVSETKRTEISSKDKKLTGFKRLDVKRSSIPAVTHVDFSSRIQTVHKSTNPKYHSLISKFKELTGCPVIVNTSFNIRGGPIVRSPEEAFKCFMGTELDFLVIGNIILDKKDQDKSLDQEHKTRYELD